MEILGELAAVQILEITPTDVRVHLPDALRAEALQPGSQPPFQSPLSHGGAPQESEIVREALADLEYSKREMVEVALAVKRGAERVLSVVDAWSLALNHIAVPLDVGRKPEIPVDPVDAVEVAGCGL